MNLKNNKAATTGILVVLVIASIITSGANAASLIVKVNETLRLASDNNIPFYGAWYFDRELVANNTHNIIFPGCDPLDTFCSDSGITWSDSIETIPDCDNATWCFEPNLAFAHKTPRQHNEFVYTPNASDIGYHSIVFRGVPLMGVPYENIYEWKKVFVGTLFVADGDIVNATTRSTLADPMSNFNVTTFVENASGIFVQESGDNGQLQFKVSSNFYNLTDGTNGIAKKTALSNGTNYVTSYNSSNKNGTFEIALNRPYAEKITGEEINVNVVSGIIKISPREDVNGNFYKGDAQDLSMIRGNKGKPLSVCPRCDVDNNGVINTDDYNQTVARRGPVQTI